LTTTTTQYDSLGRLLSVTYDDGLTANKSFGYDVACCMTQASSATYVKGRLAGTGAGISAALNTGSLFSYDPMGNVTTMWQCAPSTCQTAAGQQSRPALTFTYDLAGNLTSEGDGVSGNIIYGRSPAGEVTSITNQTYTNVFNPPNLVSSIVNGPAGPISYTLGNGLTVYKGYDGLNRQTTQWVCAGPAAFNCTTQIYGTDVTPAGSRVTSSDDTALGPHRNFGYDEFNRLSSVTGGNSFTYSYDRFGNRWSQTLTAGTGPSPSLSFDQTSNRITTP
jgi:YD repeat-containing protein